MSQSELQKSMKPYETPEEALGHAFLLNFPREASRKLEALLPLEAADILNACPVYVIGPVWTVMAPDNAETIFSYLDKNLATDLLEFLEPQRSSALLSSMKEQTREEYLSRMQKSIAAELRDMLAFPTESVGRIMDSRVIAFDKKATVGDVISQLKNRGAKTLNHLYLFDDDMQLCGQVDVRSFALATGYEVLAELSSPVEQYLGTLDPKSDAVQIATKNGGKIIPVVDSDHRLVGVLHGANLIQAMKEDITSDIQTMVGVSKEETRALSSSFFAVRKRLPWLQINLLTAFLAAAVVGMFEDTIAQFTALAVLLPVAAGQSGNTGAQALAVTMRGLTLKEITMRHWLRVTLKEGGAGFLNGIAIAITCAAGVYLWSQSYGLALVMALAMVSSMTLAGMSGALVPIVLRRLGQDPAQSSSIILTTVTDIAGFMSFLGIATLLSKWL